MVAEIFASVARTDGYVFPAAREYVKGQAVRTINGWNNSKKAFDKRTPITPWTLHDLRRTFATNLAALGAPIHITEKMLNYISGTTGRLEAVYLRHAYGDEMRTAMLAWKKRLPQIIAQGRLHTTAHPRRAAKMLTSARTLTRRCILTTMPDELRHSISESGRLSPIRFSLMIDEVSRFEIVDDDAIAVAFPDRDFIHAVF